MRGRIVGLVVVAGFVAGTLGGGYYVRGLILKQNMRTAMEIGDVETMKELAGKWPSPANAMNQENGYTPLIMAVEAGDQELVRRLLANGAEVNVEPAYYGNTPHAGIAGAGLN